jgi:hypothetical protein
MEKAFPSGGIRRGVSVLSTGLGLAAAAVSVFGAEPSAPARPVSLDPAAARPIEHFRGGPASPADIAEIATLASLPPFQPAGRVIFACSRLTRTRPNRRRGPMYRRGGWKN